MSGVHSNLSGNQRRKMRSASRLYAVQALFQMEHSSQTIDIVRVEFLNYRFGETYEGAQMEDGDIDHFTRVLEDSVNYQAQIDQQTDRALVAKWPLGRIDPTLRALFRAAGGEMRDMSIPPKVVIKEYVDPDGKEPSFVNAVLDHMAREERAAEF